jgi:hypothetical protein
LLLNSEYETEKIEFYDSKTSFKFYIKMLDKTLGKTTVNSDDDILNK